MFIGASGLDDPNKHKVKSINRKIAEINNILKNIYEDKINHVISQGTFLLLAEDYEKKKEQLLKKIQNEEQKTKNNAITNSQIHIKESMQRILQCKTPKEIPKSLLQKLIKKIEIKDKDIIIQYTFKQK